MGEHRDLVILEMYKRLSRLEMRLQRQNVRCKPREDTIQELIRLRYLTSLAERDRP